MMTSSEPQFFSLASGPPQP